ncbi:MAG TPA: response regulator, partial [Myxococcaceae bacterium]|nr:response regulator [Myxococcaceae bacterium]
MSQDKASVLLIDEDAASQKLVAGTFNRAGTKCRFIREARKTAGAVRLLEPDVLLVHGELAGPLVKDVLDGLAADVAFAAVPVVLLCRDASEARFAGAFHAGVVDLLPLPFTSAHVERVKKLIAQLPERSGRLVGQGDRAELTALVDHLRRARRSGVLIVDPLTPDEGRAFFANGMLKTAQQGGRSGAAALSAMVTRPQARWNFSNVADEAEGAAVVIEVGADEPILLTDASPEEGISLDMEVPISEELLLEEVVEEPPLPQPPAGPPTPLLLVDDDAELCRMFGLYFQKHGFQVTTATDGLQGYEQAMGQPFEAIVADLNMPRMDGWGMLRMLRDDFRTRETPVAFLSCHDDYRESLKALDAGAQAYFSKSTKLDALALQVREVLGPRGAFRESLARGQPFTAMLSHV